MGIALFINPRSRANRKNPDGIHALARAMGETGQVFSPPSLDAVADLAVSLAQAPPDIIAIHGGDGTVHSVITRLIPAFAAAGDRPLPPLALLTGGTMNVVPRSLGLAAPPVAFMEHLAACQRAGRAPDIVARRCLQVGAHYGFVFGNGSVAGFLDEYYSTGSYGASRALWIGVRAMSSKVTGSAYGKHTLPPFEGLIEVDGLPHPGRSFTAVCAATVREVGLGFKLHNRADEDPDRFNLVVVKGQPLELLVDLLPVRLGQGISPARADSLLASHVRLHPTQPDMPYTIDGDMYRTSAPLDLRIGPLLRLARPQ
ncbi:MAG: diacylglycerol kinase family protein [Deltaproteobacteria bacterium]|nr:diacylglycerol kinase family protein [Deltaproteobacteria bacterium]